MSGPTLPAPAAGPTAALAPVLRDLACLLTPTAGRSWAAPAGTLEWTVAATVDHLCDVCTWYAVQLAAGAAGHVRLDARPPAAATNAERLAALSAAGALLDTVLAAVPAERTAWHVFGPGDAARFRTMALAELTVHGHDIADGLGLPWRPPDAVVLDVLAELFPTVVLDADPWDLLLAAHGRSTLPGRARRTAWSWQPATRT